MAISGKNPCWKCNKEIVNVRFEIDPAEFVKGMKEQ
jgi:hypothetical protein